MKIEKIIVTTQDLEVNISEVTLLSRDEYVNYKNNISKLDQWWWLRSPGDYYYSAALAYTDGTICDCSVINDIGGIRPALKFSNPNLQIGDRFFAANYNWTVIGEGIALCDECVGQIAFRADWRANDANDYEASDVKKWLDRWCEKNEIIISEREEE